MAKASRKKSTRLGSSWSAADVAKMKSLAKGKVSAREAAEQLGRSRGSVAQKAMLLGISFKAIDRSKKKRK
jgi:hypothetical protein